MEECTVSDCCRSAFIVSLVARSNDEIGEMGASLNFAVVANEVKELAKQTAEATNEIGQKVGAIQTDTNASAVEEQTRNGQEDFGN